MVLLCIVLDLRSISLPLLDDLKQSLLQLANLYAVSQPRRRSESLADSVGLCYIHRNRISSSDELKIAYSPGGSFRLQDFHHAVKSLPGDAFFPEFADSGSQCCRDVKLSSVLSDRIVYSWGGEAVMRKVIVLSSLLLEDVDSITRKALMVAADRCVSVEFVLFEQKSSHLSDVQEIINKFVRCISDLDNCSFQTCLQDRRMLHGLVIRWLQELKEEMEEPLQARFIFQNDLVSSVNKIFCNLSKAFNHIIDGFNPCQTCNCHGISLGDGVENRTDDPFCPFTGHNLGALDVIENSIKVGEKTVLFFPSSQSHMKLQYVTPPVDFKMIERTNLRSLTEGLIFGASYFITPACHEFDAASDEIDQSELNTQIFLGICNALHSLDQGLVCYSNCNVETMVDAAFGCYYILLPSENGPMLLRRLAGFEEVLPVPVVNQSIHSSASKEIESAIRASLAKMESTDYNPLLHERGFHQNLNHLVQESIQYGSIPPLLKESTSELNSTKPSSLTVITKSNSATEEDTLLMEMTAEAEKSTPISQEWEQLVVNEIPKTYSPSCTLKPTLDQPILSPMNTIKQPDDKTLRILERLEAPRQLKTKAGSPIITSNCKPDTCMPMKKPLVPFHHPSQAADQGVASTQLMRPSFQRLKRKFR